MKVLFHIVHPADALFFRDAFPGLRAQGTTVVIASPEKDINCQLLDELNEPHMSLTAPGT